MDMYLLNDQKSLDTVFSVLENFRNMAGFAVNYDKTKIYRIGSLRFAQAKLYTKNQVEWTNEELYVLGITITHDVKQTLKKNYEPIIQKVVSTLKKWRNRNLSLIGKVLIVNTLIASLFVHKMQVLPMIPSKIVKKIEKIIEEFLWNKRKPKIPLHVLQMDKEKGGLKLVHLKAKDKSIKVSWVKCLQQEPKLANLVYSMIAPKLKEEVWQCNLTPKHAEIVIPQKYAFWQNVLIAWCEVKWEPYANIAYLWYNSEICIEEKPFLWPKYYDRGLKYINQLYVDRKSLSCREAFIQFGLDVMDYNSLISAIPKYLKIHNKLEIQIDP